MQPARGRGCPRHTYCGGRHRSYSFSAAEALRAAARTRYPSHPRTQRDPANRRGHRDRCTHYAHPNRAFRFSAATLLSAGGSRKNRRFAILRNMGTIGGNICLDTRCLWYNQSLTWRKSCGFCIKKDGDLCHVAPGGTKCWAAFSADTPPALLCLNAEIEIASASGVRRIPLLEFYTGLGDSYRNLAADELLTRVILPKSSAGYRGVYRKLRIRGSIDYPLAGVAVVLSRSNGHVSHGQVALTAVNPAPLIVKGASELLAGKAVDEKLAEAIGELAARTAKPLTTSALTPEYRREMIRVFTKRALLAAANGLAT